jgi:hypothetical protein
MTRIAYKPGRCIAVELPEEAASGESRTLLKSRLQDMLDSVRAPISYQPLSAIIHPLTGEAYGVAETLWTSPAIEAKGILRQLARAVPFDSPSIEVPIHLALLEDGSIVLEWIRHDRRCGFSLGPDSGLSGWFYVYSAGSSSHSESGSMDQLEMHRLIAMMTQKQ